MKSFNLPDTRTKLKTNNVLNYTCNPEISLFNVHYNYHKGFVVRRLRYGKTSTLGNIFSINQIYWKILFFGKSN